MIEDLTRICTTHRDPFYILLRHLTDGGHRFLLWPDLNARLEDFRDTEAGRALAETGLLDVLGKVQEAVVELPSVHLAVRKGVADWIHLSVQMEQMACTGISVSEYLAAKERAALARPAGGNRYTLEVDLTPFERGFPKLSQKRSIGRGVEFLNRYLAGRMFGRRGDGHDKLLEFLRLHEVQGTPLMINGGIDDPSSLRSALAEAMAVLSSGELDGSAEARAGALRTLGFEPGWGASDHEVVETMQLLSDILEAPSPGNLERFLARIPMIFSIVIVSPHGYFGQANVLGKPDTGGQVVYILDQVRALEQAMLDSIHAQGLDIAPRILVLTRLIPDAGDTTCDLRLEPIYGTQHSRILRVPFRSGSGEVQPEWISRFDVWPYLERYAVEAEREVLAELGSRPDFIIGNYSDGNLVASIMAHRLGVTQCNIAHALEKTKYPLSDVRWKALEDEHHFSCQFTADLISMNTADFIISSTYQEIAGTEDGVGQYESYRSFTMPDLYRVVAGIDCFDPKFNIVSPGADPRVFYPHSETHRRAPELTREIRDLVFGRPDAASRGWFEDPSRPVLFAMSRLDRIKNMPGLVEWYGENADLRAAANLLLVGGSLDPEQSLDEDEQRQITAMHALFDRYRLEGQARWIEMQADKNRVGELYRVVADTRGAFVQPALFEAFGLTVIEAMSSGLPVFATRFGGPLETVEDGVSGFHIDPNRGAEAAEAMLARVRDWNDDPERWERLSRAAIQRVEERYNWPLYASELLKLSRIYGFWRFVTNMERAETVRYLEMFYALMYRPLARRVAG